MKKILRRLVFLVLLCGAVGAGYWYWYSEKEEMPSTVLTLHGNVDIRQVDLAFNGSGRIEKVTVEEGDTVAQGQLLAQLETDRMEQTVARAKAQVAAQKEVVARLVAGSRPEEIDKARADVAAAKADAENATHNYHRLRDLAAKSATSQQNADDARAAANVAEARRQAAQEALDLALAGARKEDIAAARATLGAQEAALALVERELADASLYAPNAGVIQNRILEPGAMAAPQTPVYTLALMDPLWVRAYIDGTDLGKIQPGMVAQIGTDTYPDKRYEGWIGYISPTAEFTPKSVETAEVRTHLVYEVRVFVHNGQGELRLGMPATVYIDLNQSAPDRESKPAESHGES